MVVRAAGTLALGLAAAMGSPNPAAGRLDLQLGSLGLQDDSGATLTLGWTGEGLHADGSYRPAKGDDPYYFMIPSERPAQSAPVILLRIPFGNEESR